MNGIDFYEKLKKLFSAEDIRFFQYVDPICNHPELFPDVSFVMPDGSSIPPYRYSGPLSSVFTASNVCVIYPLSGPFYDLKIEEIHIKPHKMGKTVQLSIFTKVKLADKTVYSATVHVFKDLEEAESVLKVFCDDNSISLIVHKLELSENLLNGLVQSGSS